MALKACPGVENGIRGPRTKPWGAQHFFFFWLYHVACKILVPRLGIEPTTLAVKEQSPNH